MPKFTYAELTPAQKLDIEMTAKIGDAVDLIIELTEYVGGTPEALCETLSWMARRRMGLRDPNEID